MAVSFFGHIVRKYTDCLKKEIVEGSMPGTRARGRPWTAWLNNIKSWSELSLKEVLRAMEDRQQWRKIVYDAAKPRIEDGRRHGNAICQ